MSKEYRYQKFFRWGQYFIPIFYLFLIAFIWLSMFFGLVQRMGGWKAFYSYLYWSPFPTLALMFGPLLFLTFLLFVTGVFLFCLYWWMAGISISIERDGILYKTRRGEKKIQFSDLLYLDFSFLPYFGGWLKIVSKTETIRITIALEDIDNFLRELKTALDNQGLSRCYQRKKFFGFLKTAAATNQAWKRGYEIFWKFILMIIIVGIIGGLLSKFFGVGMKITKLWVAISLFWPLIICFFTEIIFIRRIAKNSDEESFSCPPRDISYERRIYQKAILIGGLLYFIAAVILFVFLSSERTGFGIYLLENNQLIISDKDILWYNKNSHEIKLTNKGVEKIRGPNLSQSLYSNHFVIKLNGKEIYKGAFWSDFSSQSFTGIVITDVVQLKDNIIRIEKGYPSSALFEGIEPRNNNEIFNHFRKLGKLVE